MNQQQIAQMAHVELVEAKRIDEQRRNKVIRPIVVKAAAECPKTCFAPFTGLHRIGNIGASEIIAALGWLLIREGV